MLTLLCLRCLELNCGGGMKGCKTGGIDLLTAFVCMYVCLYSSSSCSNSRFVNTLHKVL